MKQLYYISNSLPNKITGGSDLLALNLLNELKLKFNVTAISIGSNYCSLNELKIIHKDLKRNKIKFFEIRENLSFSKHPITIKNFLKTDYINYNDIPKVKSYIKNFNFKKRDIILTFGSASIVACSEIKAIKIAIHEDIQDQVFLFREKFQINKFNFYKKILKILILKIHFRNYYTWIKNISKNYKINYTFSKYDFNILKNYININFLPVPMIFNVKKKKYLEKKFNISMLSSNMAQDYNGIKLLNDKLIPFLKEMNLLNYCKINLVMKVPKIVPKYIESIISQKIINIKKFEKNIIEKTNLLFYPSKYPIGFRSKILFAFSNSIFVATSNIVKKSIPELQDNKNCLMSDNIDLLNQKISQLIKKPNKFKHLKINGYKVLKKYTVKKTLKILIKDISKIKLN